MEWMGRARLSGDRDLNHLIRWKRDDSGNELLRSDLSAQDLEEHRERRRGERHPIDEELPFDEINGDGEVDRQVCTTSVRGARCTGVDQSVEIAFDERRYGRYIIAGRVCERSAAVAKDSRVDTAGEAFVSKVRVSSDPIERSEGRALTGE